VASIDAFARARRQREPVGLWLGWIAVAFIALVVGWLVAEGTTVVGLIPDPPPAPLQPALIDFNGSASTALVVSFLFAAAAWWIGRRALGLAEPPGAGAGVAIALVLAAVGVLVWVLNPFAAIVIAVPVTRGCSRR